MMAFNLWLTYANEHGICVMRCVVVVVKWHAVDDSKVDYVVAIRNVVQLLIRTGL